MALLVVPPTVEPMTAADVRLRLKYPRTDQDVAIAEWIQSARNTVERYVERGLMTQTWEIRVHVCGASASGSVAALVGGESTESHVDRFTHNLTTYRSPRLGTLQVSSEWRPSVDLVWAAPLQSIVSVTDDTGVVPPASYVVDNTVEPARLYFLDPARPSGATVIRYVVGYGDTPETIPPTLRQVVFALVQQYFLFRSGPPPQSALDATLCHADGFRVRSFA